MSQQWSFVRGYTLYRNVTVMPNDIRASSYTQFHAKDFESPRCGYISPTMAELRASVAHAMLDEHLHARCELVPLDQYYPRAPSEAAAQWSREAGAGANTSVTMLRRAFSVRGMTHYVLQKDQRAASSASPVSPAGDPQTDPTDPYFRHRAAQRRHERAEDPAMTAYYEPELWPTVRAAIQTMKRPMMATARNHTLHVLDVPSCARRVAHFITRGIVGDSHIPVLGAGADDASPSSLPFDADVACMDHLLRPFVATYRFLEGVVHAALDADSDAIDLATAVFPRGWELNMHEIQYVYKIPLPGYMAVAPLHEKSMADLNPRLATYYATRTSPSYATVLDFFLRGHSIIGCCLWRLYNLHRIMAVAVLHRDTPMVHQLQLLIDSHLSLWTRCVQTACWTDAALLQRKLTCVVSAKNAARVPDCTKPEHPLAPAQLTARGFALASAFKFKLYDPATGKPTDEPLVPKWFADASAAHLLGSNNNSSSSSSSSSNNKQIPSAAMPPPPARQRSSLENILYYHWPATCDVITWEEAGDLSPLLVQDAPMYESLLDSVGINDSVNGAGGFGTSSAAGQDADRGNTTDHLLRASAMRLFVTRILPHRAGGTAHPELPRKCIEPHPSLAFMLLYYLQVFMLGNYPDAIERPSFGTRVRIIATAQRDIGISVPGIVDFVERERPLVDRALMETLRHSIARVPMLENSLRQRPNYGLWALASEVNAAFVRRSLESMPLAPGPPCSATESSAYRTAKELHWLYMNRILNTERRAIITHTAEKARKGTFIDMIMGKMRKVNLANMRDAGILTGLAKPPANAAGGTGRNKRTRRRRRRPRRRDTGEEDDDDDDDEEEAEDNGDDDEQEEIDGASRDMSDADADEEAEEEDSAMLDAFRSELEALLADDSQQQQQQGARPPPQTTGLAQNRRMREVEDTVTRQKLYAGVLQYFPDGFDIWLAHVLAERAARTNTDRRKIEWWPLILLGADPEAVAYMRQWAYFYNVWDRPDNSFTDLVWLLWRTYPRSWAAIYYYLSLYQIYSRDRVYILSEEVACRQREALAVLYHLPPTESIDRADLRGICYRCPVCHAWNHPVAPHAILNYISCKTNPVTGRPEYMDPASYAAKLKLHGTKRQLVADQAADRRNRLVAGMQAARGSTEEDDDDDGDDTDETEAKFTRLVEQDSIKQFATQSSGLTVAPGIFGKMPVTFMRNSAGSVTNAASSQMSSSMLTGATLTTDSAGLHTTGIANAQYDMTSNRFRCAFPRSRRPQNLLQRLYMDPVFHTAPLYTEAGEPLDQPPSATRVPERVTLGPEDTGSTTTLEHEVRKLAFDVQVIERIRRFRAKTSQDRRAEHAANLAARKAARKRRRQADLDADSDDGNNNNNNSDDDEEEAVARPVPTGGAADKPANTDIPIRPEPDTIGYLAGELTRRVDEAKQHIPASVTRARCCNAPLQPIYLLGRVVVTRNRPYTLCTACGSLMLYSESCWVNGYGPMCQCHGKSGGGFDVKTGTLIPSPFATHRNSVTLEQIAAPGSFRMRPRIFITSNGQLNSVPAIWLLQQGYRTPLEALARKRLREPATTPHPPSKDIIARLIATPDARGFPIIPKALGNASHALHRAFQCHSCVSEYWLQTIVAWGGRRYCMPHYVKIQEKLALEAAKLHQRASTDSGNSADGMSKKTAQKTKPKKKRKSPVLANTTM